MILERERKEFQTTAMAKARDRSSKPLHNFSLPCLKWGNQRFLRCMKLSPNTSNSSSSLIPTSVISFQNAETDANGGIEAICQKLMLDLREAADKMRHSILEDDSERPWNLRTRKAACKVPCEVVVVEKKKKRERPKFSVSLLREEVRDDFMAMVGTRPPRRPKKRARIVQTQLDSIFSGLWLTEITLDTYKLPDLPESTKV
ncbi:hypothetical protein VitviT2T_023304 [Vitis vinifera]|uniref:Uncharacterized protein n=2 Tax=Vitis vinifera TaxID=29760 RepID=A0ABY9DD73_VITVI|nr:hypothetical protein VitviT2T_023304 [Vitis vinifera]|eukprot:XP_019081135.1 PREDICTED: uncharacterized protein LOC104881810 [Vitis vinifera]